MEDFFCIDTMVQVWKEDSGVIFPQEKKRFRGMKERGLLHG